MKAFNPQAQALGITVEELQQEIKNSLFPALPDAAAGDLSDDDGGESATIKPAQGAMQKV